MEMPFYFRIAGGSVADKIRQTKCAKSLSDEQYHAHRRDQQGADVLAAQRTARELGEVMSAYAAHLAKSRQQSVFLTGKDAKKILWKESGVLRKTGILLR